MHTQERRKLSFAIESQLTNAEEIMELGNQHLVATIVVTGKRKESLMNARTSGVNFDEEQEIDTKY